MDNLAYDPLKGEGIERTDMHCHSCSKGFIGKIDFSINGNHEIICPHCGHLHYRVVQDGKITGERYDSDHDNAGRYVGQWRSDSLHIETTTAAQHIRSLWLRRSDLPGN